MKQINNNNRQSGAALIVGLVLLGILTLLTATSMNSSTVSLRMADNIKQSDLAFQAAESGLASAFFDGGPINLTGGEDVGDLVRDEPLVYSYAEESSSDPASVNASIDTTYEDTFIATGYDDGTVSVHFELQGTGSASRGAQSQQALGFTILAPGRDN